MNAPLLPEVLVVSGDYGQEPLQLAAEGVQRYVWASRFGSILIEVIGEQAFVNGQLVEAAELQLEQGVANGSDSVR